MANNPSIGQKFSSLIYFTAYQICAQWIFGIHFQCSSVPNSPDGLIFVKRQTGVLLTKIRALDGRNSSFCDFVVFWWASLTSLPSSSKTLWMCPKSQIDGQNHKNKGVRRATWVHCEPKSPESTLHSNKTTSMPDSIRNWLRCLLPQLPGWFGRLECRWLVL